MKSIQRLRNLRQIEELIAATSFDAAESIALLDAITATLKAKHGDEINDALQCAEELRTALDEVREPNDKPDEMTLAKDRQMEAA